MAKFDNDIMSFDNNIMSFDNKKGLRDAAE